MADFRWQDIQRVLTRQYDRNSFGLPLRDSEIPTSQSEELLDKLKQKWNPMTHAIFNGNLPMIKHLFENCHANSKKIVRVPGLYSTNEVNKLFPFYVALATANEEMFEYFWTVQKKLVWSEDTFEALFTLLAKREASHFLTCLLRSTTTHALF